MTNNKKHYYIITVLFPLEDGRQRQDTITSHGNVELTQTDAIDLCLKCFGEVPSTPKLQKVDYSTYLSIAIRGGDQENVDYDGFANH